MAFLNIMKLSATEESNRLDSEYFDPEELKIIATLSAKGGQPLGEICKIRNGKTPSEYIDDAGQFVVRSGDLVAPFIYPSAQRTFLRALKKPGSLALQQGDVLISSIGMGSIGKVSIVMEAKNMITVSEVTVLRNSSIPPEFLFCYLRTLIGQKQINREITGATGQQHLLKDKVARIVIPQPTAGVCKKLKDILENAWTQEKSAAFHLPEAQRIVMKSMGIV